MNQYINAKSKKNEFILRIRSCFLFKNGITNQPHKKYLATRNSMTLKYKFDWNQIISTENENYKKDVLDRAKYASFLTNYLVTQSEASENGYVLNLNASWGAGKTYFLKRWSHDLKEKHPVVYIDAWKQDYSDDPVLTVMASIINQLKDQLPESQQTILNIKTQITRFLKSAGPEITRAVVKKLSGVDLDKIESNDVGHSSNESSTEGDAASKIANALIKEHNDKLESVESLRAELGNLINLVIKNKKEYCSPAFIFIDELDRCRPNYAVEMLEVIKHFFNVPNVIFVVATDTEQLQHAVKAIYGEGFDASTYLGRFFRRRFSLNSLSRTEFVKSFFDKISALPSACEKSVPFTGKIEFLASGIANVANCFQLSLRETEQLCEKTFAVMSNTEKRLDLYLLTTLFILKDKFNTYYERWFELGRTHNLEDLFDTSVSKHPWNKVLNIAAFETREHNHLIPHDNSENLHGSISIGDFLSLSRGYSQPMTSEECRNLKQEIKLPNFADDINSKILNSYKTELLTLNATVEDYKNWIELATSFD